MEVKFKYLNKKKDRLGPSEKRVETSVPMCYDVFKIQLTTWVNTPRRMASELTEEELQLLVDFVKTNNNKDSSDS